MPLSFSLSTLEIEKKTELVFARNFGILSRDHRINSMSDEYCFLLAQQNIP